MGKGGRVVLPVLSSSIYFPDFVGIFRPFRSSGGGGGGRNHAGSCA